MTKGTLTTVFAAALTLASAGAFAQTATTPAPQQPPVAQAAPAPHATGKLALQHKKTCVKEWDADKKAGRTAGITYKAFLSKCMKEGV